MIRVCAVNDYLTGTAKQSAVTREKRDKLLPVQRDIEATDLEPAHAIAVIYPGGDDPLLLSGVVQRGTQRRSKGRLAIAVCAGGSAAEAGDSPGLCNPEH